MIDAKEKTALATSVGADERQSFQTSSANIIPTSDTEINHPDENSSANLEEIYRQMQRMNDPAYLHTVSMNDLYETVFQSRPPVIDGLLYSGTYLFAGAPKVGKSFFMAQLAYHISTGQKLHLTRNAEKLIWQLDYAETELWKKPPDPLLDKIAAVITEEAPVWNGSATELVALLQEDLQPNILTRRLNVKAGDLLNEYSIEYAVKRTRNGSFISLARKTV